MTKFYVGQRVIVTPTEGPGEIVALPDEFNVEVKVDRDGQVVSCGPNQVHPEGDEG